MLSAIECAGNTCFGTKTSCEKFQKPCLASRRKICIKLVKCFPRNWIARETFFCCKQTLIKNSYSYRYP